jgi:hypothetical protein
MLYNARPMKHLTFLILSILLFQMTQLRNSKMPTGTLDQEMRLNFLMEVLPFTRVPLTHQLTGHPLALASL